MTSAADRRGAPLHVHPDPARWDVMPGQPTADEAWAHGWTSPDGRDVLVLVGLEPRSGETHVPLTVLTTLPDQAAG